MAIVNFKELIDITFNGEKLQKYIVNGTTLWEKTLSELKGKVVDYNNANTKLNGINISIKNENDTYSATTNSNGDYSCSNINKGDYTIELSNEDYYTRNINVRINDLTGDINTSLKYKTFTDSQPLPDGSIVVASDSDFVEIMDYDNNEHYIEQPTTAIFYDCNPFLYKDVADKYALVKFRYHNNGGTEKELGIGFVVLNNTEGDVKVVMISTGMRVRLGSKTTTLTTKQHDHRNILDYDIRNREENAYFDIALLRKDTTYFLYCKPQTRPAYELVYSFNVKDEFDLTTDIVTTTPAYGLTFNITYPATSYMRLDEFDAVYGQNNINNLYEPHLIKGQLLGDGLEGFNTKVGNTIIFTDENNQQYKGIVTGGGTNYITYEATIPVSAFNKINYLNYTFTPSADNIFQTNPLDGHYYNDTMRNITFNGVTGYDTSKTTTLIPQSNGDLKADTTITYQCDTTFENISFIPSQQKLKIGYTVTGINHGATLYPMAGVIVQEKNDAQKIGRLVITEAGDVLYFMCYNDFTSRIYPYYELTADGGFTNQWKPFGTATGYYTYDHAVAGGNPYELEVEIEIDNYNWTMKTRTPATWTNAPHEWKYVLNGDSGYVGNIQTAYTDRLLKNNFNDSKDSNQCLPYLYDLNSECIFGITCRRDTTYSINVDGVNTTYPAPDDWQPLVIKNIYYTLENK